LADPNQINQALLNLFVNARDAMPEGGNLHVTSTMVTGTDLRRVFQEAREEYYSCITVRDTGVGMDEATKGRIFEPFFTTKQQGEGTGLGLSVAYGIIRSHGGFIDVESVPGQGTSFRICLPIPKEKAGLLASKERLEEKKVEKLAGAGEAILFAEDEVRQLRLMQDFLESTGYKVFTAKDGMEAVEMLLRYKKRSRWWSWTSGYPS
jgi:CheY-like chemotaxis protein